jgi:nucleoside-diphosphate-sugar epimerase
MENKRSGIFDVGTGMPISFQSVAEMVADKYNATIRYIDMPRDMKNAYQYYTKARCNVFMTKTVEDWLLLN